MSFTLLTLPQVALWDGPAPSEGSLRLEYVPGSDHTVDTKDPEVPGTLVFHVGPQSSRLEPGSPVKLLISPHGQRTYSFDVKDSEKRDHTVRLVIPTPTEDVAHVAKDIESLDQLLAQYTELSWSFEPASPVPPPLPARRSPAPQHAQHDHQANIKDNVEQAKPVQDPDLRGRLVLMDEANGDIVGELPGTMDIHEDPALPHDAKATNAVVLEMQPEMYDACTGAKDVGAIGEELREAREVIVRSVSPEERDWVMKGATLISQVISGSTSLLVSGITSASNFYIAHSTPGSPKPPSTPGSPQATPSPSSSTSALATAHAMSGKARAVSQKTADMVGSAIARAMGAKSASTNTLPPNNGGPPPYMTNPQGAPPPYAVYTPKHRPHLPRVQTEPEKELEVVEEGPRGPPKMKDRLLMSANLLITTVDDSARRVFEVSTDRLGAVVGHKYGPEAQRSTHLASYTARNVVLVYVDMRGFARKALLKKAGKEFVKARVSGNGDKGKPPAADTPVKTG